MRPVHPHCPAFADELPRGSRHIQLRAGFSADCAALNMLPSRYADALSGAASPAPAKLSS
jgi:hypothetical protein